MEEERMRSALKTGLKTIFNPSLMFFVKFAGFCVLMALYG
jgi:hypothetical protein